MLEAVFYTRFHPARGPSVIHQYPPGSIDSQSQAPKASGKALLSFQDISAYLIPPYDLCNRALSITVGGRRVLGYPISLEDPKYERNRFTLNVCFVLSEDEDARPWMTVVEKTAAFFVALEVEDAVLTTEEDRADAAEQDEDVLATHAPEHGNRGVIYTTLETVMTQLNMYGETCIRISDVHVLNLRLEQVKPAPPPKVRTWDVPLLTRALPDDADWTPDLTLQRVAPFIDGVKHIGLIATQADVEAKLVKRAICELLHHGFVLLLDIFHFGAIYTTTTDFAYFVTDPEMLAECQNYITPNSTPTISHPDLITLYTSLLLGQTLHDFTLAHIPLLTTHHIDIRRLITFGTIKGFLRRLHRHGLLLPTAPSRHQSGDVLSKTSSSPSKSKPRSNEAAVREFERAWKKAALSSGWATPPSEPPAVQLLSRKPSRGGSSAHGLEEMDEEEVERVKGFLDGRHCFDEICLAMKMTEKRLMERIRKSDLEGEVVLFNK